MCQGHHGRSPKTGREDAQTVAMDCQGVFVLLGDRQVDAQELARMYGEVRLSEGGAGAAG